MAFQAYRARTTRAEMEECRGRGADPHHFLARWPMGLALQHQGATGRRWRAPRAVTLSAPGTPMTAVLACSLALAGRKAEAEATP
jgi:hypothetical protein